MMRVVRLVHSLLCVLYPSTFAVIAEVFLCLFFAQTANLALNIVVMEFDE